MEKSKKVSVKLEKQETESEPEKLTYKLSYEGAVVCVRSVPQKAHV
jgi:hypothetical protein